MTRFIIVSGLPASGKSSLAAVLSRTAALPVFDKDSYLETLFVERTPRDPAERRALSILADRLLEADVRGSTVGIIVSWWRHPKSPADSGTPTQWLHELQGALVELHCVCRPELAVQRFRRRARHPGHLDGRWSSEALLAQFSEAARLGPLGVGALVTVDTEQHVEHEVLWERIRRAVIGRSGGS